MIRPWIARGFGFALALFPRAAGAQVHADVELEAGAEKRFLHARPPLGEDAGFGPTFELAGHLAVLPLLRAGAYVSHDISPVSGEDTREITSAGLSVRLLSPWPRGRFHAWFGAGFGYVSAYAPSYVEAIPSERGGVATAATVEGAAGGFFEVPLRIGASLRLSGPWELVLEAGARIGFGFVGSMYNQGPSVASSAPSPVAQHPAGDDSLGVFLVLGLGYQL